MTDRFMVVSPRWHLEWLKIVSPVHAVLEQIAKRAAAEMLAYSRQRQ